MTASKVMQVAAAAFALVAFGIGIAAVATLQWFKICNDDKCYNLGLYFYGFPSQQQVQRLDVWMRYKNSVGDETSMSAASGLLICSLAFMFIAFWFLVLSATRTLLERNSKTPLQVATVLISFAVLLMLIGMIVFSSNKYISQYRSDKESSTGDTVQPTVTIDIDDLFTVDPDELPGLYDMFEYNGWNRKRRELLPDEHLKKLPESQLSFGVSYILGWASFAITLCSHLFALLSCHHLITDDEEKKTTEKKAPSKAAEVAIVA